MTSFEHLVIVGTVYSILQNLLFIDHSLLLNDLENVLTFMKLKQH